MGLARPRLFFELLRDEGTVCTIFFYALRCDWWWKSLSSAAGGNGSYLLMRNTAWDIWGNFTSRSWAADHLKNGCLSAAVLSQDCHRYLGLCFFPPRCSSIVEHTDHLQKSRNVVEHTYTLSLVAIRTRRMRKLGDHEKLWNEITKREERGPESLV